MNQCQTILDVLIEALIAAGTYNAGTMLAPVAILWPDEKREWQPLIARLKEHLPALYTLGDYDPAARSGPATWLRCVLAGTVPGVVQTTSHEVDETGSLTPIFYLPGVSRAMLRAVDDCPNYLKPLAELQYRGVIFSQQSHRDWTVAAFLTSKSALGLDVAGDQDTQAAMLRALPALATKKVSALGGSRLEASDFDLMSMPSPVRALLQWVDDPEAMRAQWSDKQWQAFRAICKRDFRFDPQDDGALVAATRLAAQKDAWADAWLRFKEAPKHYPGIRERLEQAHPSTFIFDNDAREPWPLFNQKAEDALRAALESLAEMSTQAACAQLHALEAEHGERRGWVWRDLGLAPLAVALQHLNEVAQVCAHNLGGATPAAMATAYQERAWCADAHALKALGSVRSAADLSSIHAALRAVYLPWLDDAARHLQKLVGEHGYPGAPGKEARVQADPGEVILFADGLRMDVGELLQARLAARGLKVAAGTRWSALPTVTASAKPAVSPVADMVQGVGNGENFEPAVAADQKPLKTHSFRKLLAEADYQVLKDSDFGDTSGRGWTEHGQLDRMGHDEGAKLARRIDEQVRELTERIEALLGAGWKSVRIVTDHGWLLMPGGLPKIELPKVLVETRWGRCATLKPSTKGDDLLTVDWHWSPSVRIALAPGIGCFQAGVEYAHGGLSLQECLTPVIQVSGNTQTSRVTIDEVTWPRALRCRVTLSGHDATTLVDIRTKPDDPQTSVLFEPKPASLDAPTSLPIARDDLLGTAIHIVALQNGKVVARVLTSIGGE